MSLVCRLFGHNFVYERESGGSCKRCGEYQYDYDECPECGHENAIVLWALGANCLNCGYSE